MNTYPTMSLLDTKLALYSANMRILPDEKLNELYQNAMHYRSIDCIDIALDEIENRQQEKRLLQEASTSTIRIILFILAFVALAVFLAVAFTHIDSFTAKQVRELGLAATVEQLVK